MAADGRVIIDTALDSTGLQRGMKSNTKIVRDGANNITNQVGRIKNSFNSLTGTLTKVAAMLGSIFAVAKLVQIGNEAVEMASDLQEVQNVVDTAFGDMSYKMEEFANTAIETYGISKLMAKQMGSTFMAMASGMGVVGKEAADMSLSLTALSADMASFYNVSSDVASTALKSIFTGETETLKKFGIVMTETNLQEFAYSQGIQKTIKNMTQAEKVQLRYNYVMAQTSLAQGDFARTADSWANQVRVLKERWKEFLNVVGNGLIQVLTPLLQVLNQLVGKLIDVANAMALAFGFDVKSSATKGITDVVDATDDITSATNSAIKAQKKLLGGYDELNVISKDTANESATSGLGTMGASGYGTGTINLDYKQAGSEVDKLAKKFKDLAEQFKTPEKLGTTIGEGISSSLKKIDWESIKTNAYTAGQKIAEFLNGFTKTDVIDTFGVTVGQAINTVQSSLSGFTLTFDFSQTGSKISSGLNSAIKTIDWKVIGNNISNLLSGALDFVSAFKQGLDVNTISSAISDLFVGIDWLKIGTSVIKFLVTGIATAAIKFPALLVSTIAKTIAKAFTNLVNSIKSNINECGGNIILGVLNGIVNGLKGIAKWFLNNVGKPVISALKNAFKGLVSAGGEILSSILNVFKDLPSHLKKTFSDAVSAVKKVFKGIVTIVGDVVDAIIGFFLGIPKWIKDTFSNIFIKAWNGIMNTFSGVIAGIKKIFSVPLNAVIGFINAVVSGFEGVINFIIKCLNKLSFEVPDWVPGIGGETFGFDLKKVSFSKIPQLATGAVLPANKPFMAMVGDQKHGTNVEAPLDTIKQALIEALQSTGGGNNGDIVVQIDGREVFRAVQSQSNKYSKMYGKTALI